MVQIVSLTAVRLRTSPKSGLNSDNWQSSAVRVRQRRSGYARAKISRFENVYMRIRVFLLSAVVP